MPMDITGQCQAEATPPTCHPPVLNAQYRAGTSSTNQPTNTSSPGPVVGQTAGCRGGMGGGQGSLPARHHHAETEWPAHASLGLRRMEDSQLVGESGGGEAKAGGSLAPSPAASETQARGTGTEDFAQLETGGRAEAGRMGQQQHTILTPHCPLQMPSTVSVAQW